MVFNDEHEACREEKLLERPLQGICKLRAEVWATVKGYPRHALRPVPQVVYHCAPHAEEGGKKEAAAAAALVVGVFQRSLRHFEVPINEAWSIRYSIQIDYHRIEPLSSLPSSIDISRVHGNIRMRPIIFQASHF